MFTPSGKNPSSGVAIRLGPCRKKLIGGSSTRKSDEGSPYGTMCFQVKKISLGEHQTGALRGKNPCSRVGTPSRGNPTMQGFDSGRLIEKGHVGKSALSSLSEGNPISGAYKHSPPSGRNSISGRTDSEWGKSKQQSGFE